MKILLLGSNGQLGSDIEKIIKKDLSRNASLLMYTRDNLDVENLEDISNKLSKIHFDVLINCTSYHDTSEVESNATKAIVVNSHAVREMAKICQSKGSKFIQISTDYVFSGESKIPYTEKACPAPINVYGLSKYMGEILAKQMCNDTYIIRVASLFGISGASGKKGGNFVETIIKLAREKEEIRVVNDVRMSPTSTLTVARGITVLLENNVSPGVFHIVNSGNATWCEFAKKIVDRIGIDTKVIPVSSDEYFVQCIAF